MTSSIGRRHILRGLAGAAVLASPLVRAADGPTPVRFVLDWKLQGVHGWFQLALSRGYFAAEKLDVTIDQGEGSAASVTKVMAGGYQTGFGDVNAIAQMAATRPGEAPVMVYMLYNRAPYALIVKASSPVRSMRDLEGRTLGSPAGGAAAKMFPVVAARAGIDAAKVQWMNMAPNLQEQMLLKDHVEGSAVFSVTSYMNLVAQGVDPDRDIRWFHYADHGVDLYGNGVLVSRSFLRERPEAVAGLVRAIHRAVRDTLADPGAAMAALKAREPLLDVALEKRRLLYAQRTVILTPEVGVRGLGDVDDERMGRAMAQLQQAFSLPRAPAPQEVFDRRFLPSLAERKAALA